MKTRRTPTRKSTVSRWLVSVVMPSRNPIWSRPLLCEPLERRYAMYGMGWFEDSFAGNNIHQSNSYYAYGDAEEAAQVWTFHSSGQTNARPEPKLTDNFGSNSASNDLATDDLSTGDSSLDDSTSGNADDDLCEHHSSHLGPGEGESNGSSRPVLDHGSQPSTRPGLGDARPDGIKPDLTPFDPNKFETAKPEPKIEVPKVSSGPGDSNVVSSNNGLGKPASPPAGGATSTSSSTIVPNSPIRTDVSIGLGSFFALFGNSGSNSLTPTAAGPESTLSSRPSAENSSPATQLRNDATPLMSGLRADAATASGSLSTVKDSTAASNATQPTSARLSSDNAIAHSNTQVEHNLNKSTMRADSTSPSESNASHGLLEQLRAVIDNLASERQTDRVNAADHRATKSIEDNVNSGLADANRQPTLAEGGFVELESSAEDLALNIPTANSAQYINEIHQHRGQLIAALELHREFDLAGQTVEASDIVVPYGNVDHAQLAAADFGRWSEQITSQDDLAAVEGASSGSLWQQALLPLSFAAAGGLLLHSRKKYRKNKANEVTE